MLLAHSYHFHLLSLRIKYHEGGRQPADESPAAARPFCPHDRASAERGLGARPGRISGPRCLSLLQLRVHSWPGRAAMLVPVQSADHGPLSFAHPCLRSACAACGTCATRPTALSRRRWTARSCRRRQANAPLMTLTTLSTPSNPNNPLTRPDSLPQASHSRPAQNSAMVVETHSHRRVPSRACPPVPPLTGYRYATAAQP